LSPKAFAEKVRQTVNYGSEFIYIVDSAGGMMPREVVDYIHAIRDVTEVPIGFHGHNNLGLAVGNSLIAIEEGVSLVDGSLQGLGRSAGNAPTEILSVLLQKRGDSTIDSLELMNIGEEYVKPLLQRRGISSLDVVSGQAQFHTSYMGIIAKMAGRYKVDPRMLILRLTKIDKVDADPELVEKLAIELKDEARCTFTARFEFSDYFGSEQSTK
jgi:isopropylmalate/homocitrate/citramalate synthase